MRHKFVNDLLFFFWKIRHNIQILFYTSFWTLFYIILKELPNVPRGVWMINIWHFITKNEYEESFHLGRNSFQNSFDNVVLRVLLNWKDHFSQKWWESLFHEKYKNMAVIVTCLVTLYTCVSVRRIVHERNSKQSSYYVCVRCQPSIIRLQILHSMFWRFFHQEERQ